MLTILAHLFRCRLHRINLRPAGHITENKGLYECTGGEARCVIESHRKRLPRRWVFISYQVDDIDNIFSPALSYSTNGGHDEKSVIVLPRISLTQSALIRLPYNLKSLQLDPAGRPGRFRLSNISILEVGFIPLLLILSWRELVPDLGRPFRLAAKVLRGIGYVATRGPVSARDRLAGKHRLSRQVRMARDYAIAPLPVAPGDAQWQELLTVKERPRNGAVDTPVVDVVLPVYKGYDETLNCLYRVLCVKNDTAFDLIVINDGSPDDRLTGKLRELASKGLFELRANRSNKGFVKTANSGMRLHTDRDVVLLNSDTEVYNDWLDRLRRAAYSGERTGTVTPFSNNAEICSYPYNVQDNDMQLELAYSELDRTAAEVNRDRRVRIPTAVGFCMYIRRDCLAEIGYFDEQEFGRGYGEENDFCLRGEAKGWEHVLATDVFVRHLGGSSFGSEKQDMMNHAIRVINARYPGYNQRIQDFLREDPVQTYRQNIDIGRLGTQTGREVVLFVSHDWGGGIEKHVQDMSDALANAGTQVFYLRPHRDNTRAGIVSCRGVEYLPNLPVIDLQSGSEQGGNLLARLGVTHVHVHSLAGFHERIFSLLPAMLKVAGLRYDVTIHDYMTICPRIHLMGPDGRYCGEPDNGKCGKCIRSLGSPFGRVDIGGWRQAGHALLTDARNVFVPNSDVADRMARYFPDVEFTLRPHPEPALDKPRFLGAPWEPRDAVRVGVLGAIGPHKGSGLLQQCARDAQERGLPLEFIVIGYTDIDELSGEPNITVTGRYVDSEVYEYFESYRIRAVFFPATLPETYSFTLSIAIRAGLIPLAFDIGAIAERMRTLGYGNLLIPLEFSDKPALVNDLLLEHAATGVNPVQECRFATYTDILAEYYQLQ